jgi:ElaB/YqjD/DUF883 family membrane-anchored ribosome-binding protein
MKATPDKLMKDLHTVVVDAEELLKATAGQTGERIEKIRARAEGSVRGARERLQAAGQDVHAAADAAASDLHGRVQENPWAAVGIAAGVGLIAGLILGRK